MKTTDYHYKILLSGLFAVIVYVFWAFPYRAALSYHEQYQLFLLSHQYLNEHLMWPGGLSTYVAEFLVQTFNNYWIGAAVVSLLLLGLQHGTCLAAKSLSNGKCGSILGYALSFIPAILMWCSMGDLNVMPAYTVAILITLYTYYFISLIPNTPTQRIISVIAIPVIYWVAATAVYLYCALAVAKIIYSRGTAIVKAALCFIAAICTVGSIWIWLDAVNYPTEQQLIGIAFYRMTGMMPWLQISVMPSVLIVAVIYRYLPKRLASLGAGAVGIAACLFLCIVGIQSNYDKKFFEMVDYDYLLRTSNWQGIISRSEKNMPDMPLTVSATNLALGMTNMLDHRAFDFFQNTAEGLIPPFKKEANSSIATAEIYYHLGLINTAQRFYFEGMEALPNYTKSSRCIKRLAETNMLRGDYEVARKYLGLLEHTVFYRKWAQRMMALIDNPIQIDTHPVYGRIRSKMLDADFLYSDSEIDKILGQLYLKDPSNPMARQYLLMYPLLQRDPDKFMQYLQVVNQHGPYRSPIINQGVAFAYMKAGMTPPAGAVDNLTMQQFRDFAQVWTSQGKDSPALDKYRHTLWYYLVKQ